MIQKRFFMLVLFLITVFSFVSCGEDANDAVSSLSSCDQLRKDEQKFLTDIKEMDPLSEGYCEKFKARYDRYIELVGKSSCIGVKKMIPVLKEQRDNVECK